MRTDLRRWIRTVARNYGRIVTLVWRCGPALTLGIAGVSLLLGPAPVVTFLVTKRVVDAIAGASGRGVWWPSLWPWLAALAAIQVGRLAADELREAQRHALRENVDAWMSAQVAAAACRADLAELCLLWPAHRLHHSLLARRDVGTALLRGYNLSVGFVDSGEVLIERRPWPSASQAELSRRQNRPKKKRER